LLEQAAFPADKLAAVAHAIEAHSFSANIAPQTDEARIVQDADRMDALGAIGLRACLHLGPHGSATGASGQAGRGRALDDREYALDHIGKAGKLPGMMQTEAGRAMAGGWHACMPSASSLSRNGWRAEAVLHRMGKPCGCGV
jgi:uncharacterized protein